MSGPAGARAVARCDLLGTGPYSDTPDGLFRAYLTPAFARTQETVGAWMVEAGMQVRLDAAANLVGRYEGSASDAPALMIGSHLDSVRDAGRYDGPLGVMLGIDLVATLAAAGRRLPFAVEVVAFGDEEGSRFPTAMLTSRAVAGTLDPGDLDIADGDGVTVAQAFAGFGVGDVAAFAQARRAPGSVLGYLEAHIEQGPVLEAEGFALGIVTGIAAQLRYRITVTGMAGHAGTTTMALRRDALAAAAEMIVAVERHALADAADLVATVGRIEVSPGAPNVIAGTVVFTLDVRSGDQPRRDTAAAAMLAQIAAIATRRGVEALSVRTNDLAAGPCDPALVDMLGACVQDQGLGVRRLVSGAGHDAMVLAALCPTAMLFIRCVGGISHNPAEAVDVADVDAALRVMIAFVERLGETFDA